MMMVEFWLDSWAIIISCLFGLKILIYSVVCRRAQCGSLHNNHIQVGKHYGLFPHLWKSDLTLIQLFVDSPAGSESIMPFVPVCSSLLVDVSH